MRVSVLLVSYNTAAMTIEALQALQQSEGEFELEVLLIDNASVDDSVERIKQHFPQYKLIENQKNVGFGRANNQLLPYVTGDYVLLLNTDAFVEKDTLQKTLDYMQAHAQCGVLGVHLIGRDGTTQPSCRYFPTVINMFAHRFGLHRWFNIKLVDDPHWDSNISQTCDWVPGCYYLMRKPMIDQVGLFDPLYFLYSEEVDHCLAVKRAGWQVHYFAGACVVHVGGESAKSDHKLDQQSRQANRLQLESEQLYLRKNHSLLSVLAHISLNNLGDIYDMVKSMVYLDKAALLAQIKKFNLPWKVFFETKFATRATR